MSAKDLTGLRFGRLTVTEMAGRRNRQVLWKCKCDCGKDVTVIGGNLRNNSTQSCGCLNKQNAAMRKRTHGGTDTRLYRIWHNMKNRCQNRRTKDYEDYGGRGIEVCPEWRESFEAFRDWAVANGYQDHLTIERNDTDGGYCPDNCRWVTNKEQQSNRRNNHLVTYNGKTQTLQQWVEETGIKRGTLSDRLRKGWSPERALTEPVKTGGTRDEK